MASAKDKKINRLTTVPDEFLSKIPKAESQVYDKVVEIISRLEISGGNYVISSKNLKAASEVSTMLRGVLLESDYTNFVAEFAKEFDTQAAITNSYFAKEFSSFTASEMAASVVETSKRQAIDLLLNRASDAEFIKPLQGIIEQSVINGSGYSETLKSIREFVQGNEEVPGGLERYSRTYAHDTFAIADRSHTSVVSEELEAEWFLYSGDTIATTRPFCDERHNEYFYYKEIQAWGKGERTEGMAWPKDNTWSGRIPETNSSTIFSYCGGFGCRHNILPVSIFSVPREVIQRNIDAGWFTPNAFEAKELGFATEEVE